MAPLVNLKTGTLVWAGLKGPVLSAEEKQWIQKEHISALVLFKRNIYSLKGLCDLVKELKSLSPPPLIVMDREGGAVDRLRHLPEVGCLPSPALLAQLCSLEEIRQTGFYIGEEMRALGLDMNLAPLWDVLSVPSSLLKGRVFAAEAEASHLKGLADRAVAFSQGLREAGLPTVAKHFPGHGGVSGDSHHQLPIDHRKASDLMQSDIKVFHRAIGWGVDSIMSSHVLYPCWDTKNPATFSEKILKSLLRDQLGFKGLVLSDDLDMGAVCALPLKKRVGDFLRAGGDIALKCQITPEGDVFALPEELRKQTGEGALSRHETELKIQKVQAFKTRFLASKPKLCLKDFLTKNSKTQSWCRNIIKRLKKQ